MLAACRSYHQLLPDLFEGLDDANELLSCDLLTEDRLLEASAVISDSGATTSKSSAGSIVLHLRKKDEVGKVVKSEDIPAATQLLRNWIVKYMVQNTIGAQWLATYPDSPLRQRMEFYIEPAEQTDEVKKGWLRPHQQA